MTRKSKIDCQKPLKNFIYVYTWCTALLSYSNLDNSIPIPLTNGPKLLQGKLFSTWLEAQSKTICRKKTLMISTSHSHQAWGISVHKDQHQSKVL